METTKFSFMVGTLLISFSLAGPAHAVEGAKGGKNVKSNADVSLDGAPGSEWSEIRISGNTVEKLKAEADKSCKGDASCYQQRIVKQANRASEALKKGLSLLPKSYWQQLHANCSPDQTKSNIGTVNCLKDQSSALTEDLAAAAVAIEDGKVPNVTNFPELGTEVTKVIREACGVPEGATSVSDQAKTCLANATSKLEQVMTSATDQLGRAFDGLNQTALFSGICSNKTNNNAKCRPPQASKALMNAYKAGMHEVDIISQIKPSGNKNAAPSGGATVAKGKQTSGGGAADGDEKATSTVRGAEGKQDAKDLANVNPNAPVNPNGEDKANPKNLPVGKHSSGRGEAVDSKADGMNTFLPLKRLQMLSSKDNRSLLACPIALDKNGNPCEPKGPVPNVKGFDQLTQKLVLQAVVNRKIRDEVRGLAHLATRPGLGEGVLAALNTLPNYCENAEMKEFIKKEKDAALEAAKAASEKSKETSESVSQEFMDAAKQMREIDKENMLIAQDFLDNSKPQPIEGQLEDWVKYMSEGWTSMIPCQTPLQTLNELSRGIKIGLDKMSKAEKEKNFRGACRIDLSLGSPQVTATGASGKATTISCDGSGSVDNCRKSCKSRDGKAVSEIDQHLFCQTQETNESPVMQKAAEEAIAQEQAFAKEQGASAQTGAAQEGIDPKSPVAALKGTGFYGNKKDLCVAKSELMANNLAARSALIAKYPELSQKLDGKPLYQRLGDSYSDPKHLRQAKNLVGAEVIKLGEEFRSMCEDPEKAGLRSLANFSEVNQIFSCGGKAQMPIPSSGDPALKDPNVDEECKFLRKNAPQLCGLVGTPAWNEYSHNNYLNMVMESPAGAMAMIAMDVASCAPLLGEFAAFGAAAGRSAQAALALARSAGAGAARRGVAASLARGMKTAATIARGIGSEAFEAGVGAAKGIATEARELVDLPVKLAQLGYKAGKAGTKWGTKAELKAAANGVLQANIKSAVMVTGFTAYGVKNANNAVTQAGDAVNGARYDCLTGTNGASCERIQDAQEAFDKASTQAGWEAYKFAILGALAPNGGIRVAGGAKNWLLKQPKVAKFVDNFKVFKASEEIHNNAIANLGLAQDAYAKDPSPANQKAQEKAYKIFEVAHAKYLKDGAPLKSGVKTVADILDPGKPHDNMSVAEGAALARLLTEDNLEKLAGEVDDGRDISSPELAYAVMQAPRREKPAKELTKFSNSDRFVLADKTAQSAAKGNPVMARHLADPGMKALVDAGKTTNGKLSDAVIESSLGKLPAMIDDLNKGGDLKQGRLRKIAGVTGKTRESVNALAIAHLSQIDPQFTKMPEAELKSFKQMDPETLANVVREKEAEWVQNKKDFEDLQKMAPDVDNKLDKISRESVREEGSAAKRIYEALVDKNGEHKLEGFEALCLLDKVSKLCPPEGPAGKSVVKGMINDCRGKKNAMDKLFFEAPAASMLANTRMRKYELMQALGVTPGIAQFE